MGRVLRTGDVCSLLQPKGCQACSIKYYFNSFTFELDPGPIGSTESGFGLGI